MNSTFIINCAHYHVNPRQTTSAPLHRWCWRARPCHRRRPADRSHSNGSQSSSSGCRCGRCWSYTTEKLKKHIKIKHTHTRWLIKTRKASLHQITKTRTKCSLFYPRLLFLWEFFRTVSWRLRPFSFWFFRFYIQPERYFNWFYSSASALTSAITDSCLSIRRITSKPSGLNLN